MEPQTENTVSSQQSDLDRVLEKIAEIGTKSAEGDYIYRGERARHEETPYYGTVTSGLYRYYRYDLKIDAEHVNVNALQAQILIEAKEYIHDKKKDLELLATLQHYGGKTNLIDFTTDYLIALFFACEGEFRKPGRVILLSKESYDTVKPPGTIRRADIQKSIFVQVPQGVITPEEFNVVYIPANLKLALLGYLRKSHDISTKTIYNDLHGFIEERRLHENAYIEFDKGVTSQNRADLAETEAEKQERYNDAITHYTKAIDLNPELAKSYYNRGVVYLDTGDFVAAIEDFKKAIVLYPEDAEAYYNRGVAYSNIDGFLPAIKDFDEAIKLDLKDSIVYFYRGVAWLYVKEWQKAKADLTDAENLLCIISMSFENTCGSVEAFEEKIGVKLPKDIAALLQRK